MLNKDLSVVTDKFLRIYKCGVDESYSANFEYQKDLVSSNILDCIVEKCIFHNSYGVIVIYPWHANNEQKKYVIGTKRNVILSKCWGGKIEESNPQIKKIFSDQRIENSDFFWGWHIGFVYRDKKFQWNSDGNIYLLDPNWNRIPISEESENYKFCLLSKAEMDLNKMANNPKQFTEELDKLIESCPKEETS